MQEQLDRVFREISALREDLAAKRKEDRYAFGKLRQELLNIVRRLWP